MNKSSPEVFVDLAVRLGFISGPTLEAAMREPESERLEFLKNGNILSREQRGLLERLVPEYLACGDRDSTLVAVLPTKTVEAQNYALGPDASDDTISPNDASRAAIGRSESDSSRYAVLRLHAKGGLGEVYVARDCELDREVALKEIQPQFADAEITRARFVREAEITGRLEHPNIVPVYGLGVNASGRPYYAMRFIRGESLKEANDRFHANRFSSSAERNLGFRPLLKRFIDACNAIAYAHSRGIIHRDIKPANIMLGNFGETLVVDWGLAKATASGPEASEISNGGAGGENSETQYGSIVGTYAYMSPEQLAGQNERVGPAADLYSLGATLYTIVTGQLPITGTFKDFVETGKRIAGPSAGRVVRNLPRALDSIIAKAMADDPNARYSNATELAEDVDHLLADEPVKTHRENALEKARRWSRRHPKTVAALAATIIVGFVGVLGGALVLNGKNRELDGANSLLTKTNTDLDSSRADAENKKQQAERARDKAREALDAMTSSDAAEALATQGALSAEQVKFLTSAVAFYEELTKEEGDDDEALHRRGVASSRVASTLYQLGKYAEAIPAREKSVAAFRKLVSRSDTPENKYYLAIALDDLGVTHTKSASEGKSLVPSETFESYIEESSKIRISIRDYLHSDPDKAFQYALALYRIGETRINSGKYEESVVHLRDSDAVIEQLIKQDPKGKDNRLQFRSRIRALIAKCHRVNGEAAEWESEIILALKISRKLIEGNPYHRDFLELHIKNISEYGAELFRQNRLEEHKTALEEHRSCIADLAFKFPAIGSYRLSHALAQKAQGESARRRNDFKSALRYYDDCLGTLTKLAEDFPNDSRIQSATARSLCEIAICYNEIDQKVKGKMIFENGLMKLDKIRSQNANQDNLIDFGNAMCEIANSIRDTHPKESLGWYEKSAAILDPILRLKDSERPGSFIHNPHWGLAEAREMLGEYSEAAREWSLAIETSQPFRHPSFRERLIRASYNAGEYAEAVEAIKDGRKDGKKPTTVLYFWAIVSARASVKGDSRAEENQLRAVELMTEVIDGGYSDCLTIIQGNFVPLFERDDFLKQLARLKTPYPKNELPRTPQP